MRVALFCLVLICWSANCIAQDSIYNFEKNAVTLKEVVVRSNLNVPAFIKRVKEDTTFHKAFVNLRVLGYTSINDIRMLDKKGAQQASLQSRTKQEIANHCRWTKVLEEKSTGDIYDEYKNYNYYTPQLYASIFFAPDTVCGENNIVAGSTFKVEGKTGIAKHKEQLKMLFFNPGKRIPGLPFIGNKVAIFDKDVAENYDFIIDMGVHNNQMCYIFKIIPLADRRSNIVINEMTTWFNQDNWEIVARNYDLSYNAGVYDFDVHIEVEMTKFHEYIVPKVMRYNGNWDIVFKKREKGIFTATLFDFRK
ncbi:MAG: hypothetical protein J7497_02955 [Chitinophagaceae bacterium]|nr:hypothetical protein [Chitinophagaceae bacterium]